jgi:hypothetical protein
VRRAWLACVCACGTQQTTPSPPVASLPPTTTQIVVTSDPPAPLVCITKYYGGSARQEERGVWSLVLDDGTAIPYDDVKQVYEIIYPTGTIKPITEIDFDPGRVRIDSLMMATYGKTAADVQHAMVSVRLGGKWFGVHEKIAEPLKRVAARIDKLHDASLAKFFESPGGTFNWRKIAGTDELSMHAWAIAIDLDTTRSNYWRNERQDKPLVWKNSYPQAIVDAFEAEGFIWGGRWYHFDTMHFEYRPELLDPSCYPVKG